jgi:hypothetical protein
MPIANYVATVRLTPITEDNKTFAQWSAEFDVTDGSGDTWVDNIGKGVFAAGFAALNQYFAHAAPSQGEK